ncbi:MAG: hypothetical protein JWO39_879, partial [Gemmatimonadetes bacterium]|nr:hypothetical protein [Gemmatimonadota bacterium]
SRLDTVDGPFDVNVWRYEKRLTPTTSDSASRD